MSSSNTSSLWDFGNSGRKKCQVRQLTDTTIQRWEVPLSILKERLLGNFLFDIFEVFNLFDPWDFNRLSRRRCRRSWPIIQGSAFLATWLRFNLVSRSLASHNRHEASLLTCDGLDVLNFGPKLHHMDPPSIPLCVRFDFDPTSPCFSRLAALRYPLTPQYVASVWAGCRRPNFWPVHSGCGTTSCGPSRSCRAQSDVDLDLDVGQNGRPRGPQMLV